MPTRPPRSALFPYTTLFRSIAAVRAAGIARSSSHDRRRRRTCGPLGTPKTLGRRGLGRRARITRRRSEEHTSELQSRLHLVCRLLLEKKKYTRNTTVVASC